MMNSGNFALAWLPRHRTECAQVLMTNGLGRKGQGGLPSGSSLTKTLLGDHMTDAALRASKRERGTGPSNCTLLHA